MKKFFYLAFACALALSATAQNPLDWATGELKKAQDALVESRAKISESRANLAATILQERNATSALLEKINACTEFEKSRDGLFEMSKYYDAVGSEIYSDAYSCAKANLEIDMPPKSSATISEATDGVRAVIDESLANLFSPFRAVKCEAVAVSDKARLAGEKFSVGGFDYFVSGNRAGFISIDGFLYGEKFSTQIIAFMNAQTDRIPADVSDGALLQREKNSRTLAQEISLGGIWMYPILFFGGISLLVCVFKIFSFLRIRRLPNALAGKIFAAIDSGRESDALLDAKRAGYPYSALMTDLILSRKLPPSKLEEISYESMLSAGGRLFAGLSVLSVTAAVAPLFGLLGTVTGIIKTFGDLSFQGAAQSQFISAGISEALITTEYGLIVAIPAFVAHALFSRRAKAILADMEKMASSFLGRNS